MCAFHTKRLTSTIVDVEILYKISKKLLPAVALQEKVGWIITRIIIIQTCGTMNVYTKHGHSLNTNSDIPARIKYYGPKWPKAKWNRKNLYLKLFIVCLYFFKKGCQNIYSDTYQSPSFSVHQGSDSICRKPITLTSLSFTILSKILNAANDKLVTQVLCFMFSPLLSNVSHWGWDHQANCSSQKNGPIDSQRNNFSGGSI